MTITELVLQLESLVTGYEDMVSAIHIREDILRKVNILRDRIDELGGYHDDV